MLEPPPSFTKKKQHEKTQIIFCAAASLSVILILISLYGPGPFLGRSVTVKTDHSLTNNDEVPSSSSPSSSSSSPTTFPPYKPTTKKQDLDASVDIDYKRGKVTAHGSVHLHHSSEYAFINDQRVPQVDWEDDNLIERLATENCPGKCNKRGKCMPGSTFKPNYMNVTYSDYCKCDEGFSGHDCSIRICTGCHRPDFSVIGVQKGGTTFAHQALSRQPHISERSLKLHFCDSPIFDTYEYNKDFFSFFTGDGILNGEGSPRYFVDYPSPARLFQAVGREIKLILLVRDPVTRAFSSYNMGVKKKKGQSLPGNEEFPEHVETEIKRLHKCMHDDLAVECLKTTTAYLLLRGLYYFQMVHWLRFFPLENFIIVKSEDFFKDSVSTVGEIVKALGVPYDKKAQERLIAEMIKTNTGTYTKPIDEKSRKRLAEYYRPYNRMFYELVGRDFGWMEE